MNPPNSSHPTSLEAQAEKGEQRFEEWWKAQVEKVGARNISEVGNCQDSWCAQDAHYQPIVEALKAEVAQTHREYDALKIQTDARIEQLTAELADAKKLIEEYSSHDPQCDITYPNRKCSCGYDELKSALHEKREQQG